MSHSPVRRRRTRLIGLLSVVAVAAAMLVTAPIAEAGKPAPTPAATISITRVWTPDIAVPETLGSAGLSYVVKQRPFNVNFTTSAVLSDNKDTPIVVTARVGNVSLGTVGSGFLKAGEAVGEVARAELETEANDVTLTVAVDARKADVIPGTITIDVLKNSDFYSTSPTSPTLFGIGGGGAPGIPCDPTPTDPNCGDLILPSGVSVNDQGLLVAQGCGVVNCVQSSLQLLFGTTADVDRANPITFIAKCDKSVCAGKGIKSYKLAVSLDASDPDLSNLSPACTDKGVVNEGAEFCTDYVQSTRDGAGDVLLYLLFLRDAKIIFG